MSSGYTSRRSNVFFAATAQTLARADREARIAFASPELLWQVLTA